MPSSGTPSRTPPRPRGLLGRADLAEALAAGDAAAARAIAELAGFEWAQPEPGRADEEPATGAPILEALDEPEGPEPAPEIGTKALRPASIWLPLTWAPAPGAEETAPGVGGKGRVVYRGWTGRPQDPPAIPPLAEWRELEPRLRPLLCLPQQSRALDLDLAVRWISRGRFLGELPRQRRRRWGPTLHILEDRSARLIPYRLDQYQAQAALSELLPDHSLSRGVCRDGCAPELALGGPGRAADALPPPGTLVLVLGDLGCLSRSPEALNDAWLHLGRVLRAAGCLSVALFPAPLERCPRRLVRVWRPIPWERPRPRDPADTIEARAERLLCLVSPAVRIEPGLLRAARLLLPPGAADAGTESDVWQHPDLDSRSPAGATLNPGRARQLRARFAGTLDPQLQLRLALLLRRWRGHLAEEIWFEELLNLPPWVREAPALASDLGCARDYFSDLAGLWGGGEADVVGSDRDWFGRVETRAGADFWGDRGVGDDLRRISHALHEGDPDWRPPPGFRPELVRRRNRPVRRWRLAQRGPLIEIRPVETGASFIDGVSPLGEVETQNGLLQVLSAPPWAEDWGRDAYGLWASFSIEGPDRQRVSQRMRWIEPGRFWMGSPEDEPERHQREGPRHEVRLSEGFWLFATACTQAVWEAVMGGNPARFRDPWRPVEQVSWEDAQAFIARLNERVPGLELRLPSEAQWEYACRAGTDTPFSLGANIAPEQVNYHGEYPYHGGVKGLYRGETVAVGSLPPNPWGLYEMHGNVWEWVQDAWHDDYRGAPADGTAWEGDATGAGRVIRGGSWVGNARHCRCASRLRYRPDSRYYDLGFRCARAQAAEPGRPGGTSGAPFRAAARPAVAGEGARTVGGGRSEGQGGLGTRAGDRDRPLLLRLDGSDPPEVPIPDAPILEVHTDRQVLTLRRVGKPDWASALGRDRVGPWAEIAIEPSTGPPVIQRLRWIPPGRFLMGSPEDEPGRWDDEGPRHPVTIGTGFWLFDTPCTQSLWEAVMGQNPSRFRDPERPVERVSWKDAQGFLERINGLVPGLGLALPSEAQWEHACRAGTESALYSGGIEILGEKHAPALDAIAWYGGNSGVEYDLDEAEDTTGSLWREMQYATRRAGTRKVKGKAANAWGLYDMLGNVWEWTQDTWHERYEGAPETGVAWKSPEAGAARVIRGGSWLGGARYCRCASRLRYQPVSRYYDLGFRCARAQGS